MSCWDMKKNLYHIIDYYLKFFFTNFFWSLFGRGAQFFPQLKILTSQNRSFSGSEADFLDISTRVLRTSSSSWIRVKNDFRQLLAKKFPPWRSFGMFYPQIKILKNGHFWELVPKIYPNEGVKVSNQHWKHVRGAKNSSQKILSRFWDKKKFSKK